MHWDCNSLGNLDTEIPADSGRHKVERQILRGNNSGNHVDIFLSGSDFEADLT